MAPPFEQKTGGKGANAAAAAGQTLGCELVCQFGRASAAANAMLLSDLQTYGGVDTSRSRTVEGPTGTAYILLFEDNDNGILLLGGANQAWEPPPLASEGSALRQAIAESSVVMLQREIPEYVNVEVARAARELGRPVFMDVGGTDAPLDAGLVPYISVIAPNETELTFISGVETAEGGSTSQARVRAAVAALRARFAAGGNTAASTSGRSGRRARRRTRRAGCRTRRAWAVSRWQPRTAGHGTPRALATASGAASRPHDTARGRASARR